MQRVSISVPSSTNVPITELGNNWLNLFTLSNIPNLDLSDENTIEFIGKYYENSNTEVFTAKHIMSHVSTVPYSELENKYIYFGESAFIACNEKLSDHLCHVGVALFENCGDSCYKNIALLITQNAKKLSEINLQFIQFNMEMDENDEFNPPLIQQFTRTNTNILPLEKLLDFVYKDRKDLSTYEKFELALSELISQNYGLDSSHTDPYGSLGVCFERKLIDFKKQTYQKVEGSVQYNVFGNTITYIFDISDAPEKPKDLKFKSVTIKTASLHSNNILLGENLWEGFTENAFNVLKKSYMFKDRYYDQGISL